MCCVSFIHQVRESQSHKSIVRLFDEADMLLPIITDLAVAWAERAEASAATGTVGQSSGAKASVPAGAVQIVRPTVKNSGLAFQETFSVYGGKCRYLCDLLSVVFVCDGINDVISMLRVLQEEHKNGNIILFNGTVVTNNFLGDSKASMTKDGYRCIILRLVLRSTGHEITLKSDHVCELQIHLSHLYGVRDSVKG